MGLDTFTFENIVFSEILLEMFQTYWGIYLLNIGYNFGYGVRFIIQVSPYTVANE